MPRNGDSRRQNISALLRQYGERAAQAAREALIENGETVVEEAKRRCPVDTGALRDSIHAEQKSADKIRIVADAQAKDGYYYGRMIEYGPHGTPFMKPALEAKREELKQHTMDRIRAAITQH